MDYLDRGALNLMLIVKKNNFNTFPLTFICSNLGGSDTRGSRSFCASLLHQEISLVDKQVSALIN